MYKNPMLEDTRYPTCLAPWNALTIKWGGAVLPDIIYNGKFGNIASDLWNVNIIMNVKNMKDDFLGVLKKVILHK